MGQRETDRRSPADKTTSSVVASSATACTSRRKTRGRHMEECVPPVVRKIILLPFVVPNNSEKCDSLIKESLLSLYNTADKRCYTKFFVDGQLVRFLFDNGSMANVIPVTFLTTISKLMSDLKPSSSRLSMFDHIQLRTPGELSAKLIHPRMILEFYVAETDTAVLDVRVSSP
jgi:hypothetical protein